MLGLDLIPGCQPLRPIADKANGKPLLAPDPHTGGLLGRWQLDHFQTLEESVRQIPFTFGDLGQRSSYEVRIEVTKRHSKILTQHELGREGEFTAYTMR